MAKRKCCFNLEKIEKLRAEGRGRGNGRDYSPWILAHDIKSIGLTTRIAGHKSGRVHHFLSRLEVKYFYLLEWSDIVVDIREQFPLDHHVAFNTSEEAGINYPWERNTGYDAVLTTDFLINVADPSGGSTELARTLKYVSEFRSKRGKAILEKLEIERRYWSGLGIDWGIVTELQIPQTLVANIEDCYDHRELGDVVNFGTREVDTIESLIRRHAQEHPDHKLNALAATVDQSFSLELGTGLAVIKHLLANKRLVLPGNIRWLKDGRCRDISFSRRQLAEVV